jgi:hypothetical protein
MIFPNYKGCWIAFPHNLAKADPLNGGGNEIPMNDSKKAKGIRLRGGDNGWI